MKRILALQEISDEFAPDDPFDHSQYSICCSCFSWAC